MDFGKLRKDLGERYFKIDEYFNASFDVFKHLMGSKWGKILLVLLVIRAFMGLSGRLLIAMTTLELISFLMMTYTVKKVVETVEEKSENGYFRIVGRYFLLTVIFSFVIVTAVLILTSFMIKTPLQNISSELLSGSEIALYFKFLIAVYALVFIFLLIRLVYFTYFTISYVIRDITMGEALKYGLHLNKGNKWRIIAPSLIVDIILLIVSGISLVFFNIPVVFEAFRSILIIINLYNIILIVLVYLNVEYVDLSKSKDKDSRTYLRNGKLEEIDRILEIIESAKKKMAERGLNQWNEKYPAWDSIKEDIDKQNSYVLVNGEKIVATGALCFEGEKAYEQLIFFGKIEEGNYGTIHRFAVDYNEMRKGYADKLIEEMEKVCLEKNMGLLVSDTHRDNVAMENCFIKNGMNYVGLCYYEGENGEKLERKVYVKKLK